MNRNIICLLFVANILAGNATVTAAAAPVQMEPAAAGAEQKYVIGSGDTLEISVWKAEGLTKTVVVLPDGTITFPLAGEVSAAGKTIAELKKELEKRLARYVTDLILTVDVQQSNSMLVYVIGKVNNPGRQILNSRITVLQALAMAGGPNVFADKNGIKVFRHEGDTTAIHHFRYSEVVEGEKLEQNILLKRGDVIVVP
jgi:polysaccharide biosynthesis/export protein